MRLICHYEERSDEVISKPCLGDRFTTFAMTAACCYEESASRRRRINPLFRTLILVPAFPGKSRKINLTLVINKFQEK
jgi:hypothetical protein